MARRSLRSISAAQLIACENRIVLIAKAFGFVGNVEYRHLYSQTGGAQYGRGSTPEADLLSVFVEAFERDADPEDFSLEAMIAHEWGHQILARHAKAAAELLDCAQNAETPHRQLQDLWELLEALL